MHSGSTTNKRELLALACKGLKKHAMLLEMYFDDCDENLVGLDWLSFDERNGLVCTDFLIVYFDSEDKLSEAKQNIQKAKELSFGSLPYTFVTCLPTGEVQ